MSALGRIGVCRRRYSSTSIRVRCTCRPRHARAPTPASCNDRSAIREVDGGHAATVGLPGSDGALVISNGVTRATRVAKLLPGVLIRVEVIGDQKTPVGHYPTGGDRLP